MLGGRPRIQYRPGGPQVALTIWGGPFHSPTAYKGLGLWACFWHINGLDWQENLMRKRMW